MLRHAVRVGGLTLANADSPLTPDTVGRAPFRGGPIHYIYENHSYRAVPVCLFRRIMISQKAKYAFQALLALAQVPEGETLVVSEMAEKHNLPRKFLEQILLDLKHHGILASRRGKKGGYALLKAPKEITFGEVLRVIDGPIAPLPCLSRMAYRRCAGCPDETACGIRRIFAEAYEATASILDRRTVADALACDPVNFAFERGRAKPASA